MSMYTPGVLAGAASVRAGPRLSGKASRMRVWRFCVSGSEAAATPRYVSLQGSVLDPPVPQA